MLHGDGASAVVVQHAPEAAASDGDERRVARRCELDVGFRGERHDAALHQRPATLATEVRRGAHRPTSNDDQVGPRLQHSTYVVNIERRRMPDCLRFDLFVFQASNSMFTNRSPTRLCAKRLKRENSLKLIPTPAVRQAFRKHQKRNRTRPNPRPRRDLRPCDAARRSTRRRLRVQTDVECASPSSRGWTPMLRAKHAPFSKQ